MPVRQARPREPKIATVERREASVPRYGTQGASQAPGVPRYVHAHGCSAEHPNVSRRSAHPSIRVSEAKLQNPGRKCVAGTMECVLFERVSRARRDARPHPEERGCRKSSANSNARTRISKDEDERLPSPSCFETHRSPLRLREHLRSRRAAMHLSMRAREARRILAKRTQCHLARRSEADVCVFGPSGGPTWGCTKSLPGWFPCFRPIIYNE